MKLTLFHYWRSSCSWRVRWALEHKNIPFEAQAINLLEAEHQGDTYKKLNPMGQVPCLIVDGIPLSDSMAILEFLETSFPQSPLLPKDAIERAKVRRLANLVSSGIQPIQNLAVMRKVSTDRSESSKWSVYWINRGFEALEAALQDTAGAYSYGDALTFADLCLVPQCYNAERFNIDLSKTPTIAKVYANCKKLDSCTRAAPDAYKPE